MSLTKLQEMVKDRQAWTASVHGVSDLDMTEQLNNNRSQERIRLQYNYSRGFQYHIINNEQIIQSEEKKKKNKEIPNLN